MADLGLGDIFQIVSLSRRSGTLQLTTPSHSGEVVFNNGRVVAVYVTGDRPSVGECLLEAGVIPATTYQEMLAAHAGGTALAEVLGQFGIDPAAAEDALEGLLKETVYQMFDWDEGTFSFVLEENPDPTRGFSLAGTRVALQHGLNPQYLAIEGARLRDERTKDDALESFLARDKPRPTPLGKLSRATEVQTFAAKLRDNEEQGDDDGTGGAADKVIPFPGPGARRESPAAPLECRAAEAPSGVGPRADLFGEPPSGDAPASAARLDMPAPATPTAEAVVISPREVASADAISNPPPPAPVEGGPTSIAVHRLLLIDDDPQVTRALHHAFADRFAAVVIANSVRDALLEIEQGQPGLVVAADLIIARSDGGGILGGIEILERVRQRSPEVPVILFTDYENAEAQERARRLGVSGFLTKPRKAQIQAGKDKPAPSSPLQQFISALGQLLEPFVGASRHAAMEPEPLPVAVPGVIEPGVAAEPEPLAVSEPIEASVAAEPEPLAVSELTEASVPAEPEPSAVSELTEASVAAEPGPLAVSELIETNVAAEPAPSAVSELIETSVPAEPAPSAVSELTGASVAAETAPESVVAEASAVDSQLLAAAQALRAHTELGMPYDLRRDFAGVIDEVDLPVVEGLPPRRQGGGPVDQLRSMLAELLDPANRETVTLLVLRFASLLFERAALFLVTRRAFVGLGGFSNEVSSDRFVFRVRKIQIPTEEPSAFSQVVKFRTGVRAPLERLPGNVRLMEGVGGSWPAGEAAAIPLVTNDRVAAVLYGDNPSGRQLAATDTLEIFLQQAGLAMERVLLERRLEEARRRGTEHEGG